MPAAGAFYASKSQRRRKAIPRQQFCIMQLQEQAAPSFLRFALLSWLCRRHAWLLPWNDSRQLFLPERSVLMLYLI